MATIYFTAATLDGFIVDETDSLDWLVTRDFDPNGPFGYEAFVAEVGALAMGSSTYEWIVKNQPGQWMYAQPSWVLTSRPGIVAAGHPVRTFDGDVTNLHDEMVVTYAPCTLGAGARLLPIRSEWELIDVGRNGEFVCARWRTAA